MKSAERHGSYRWLILAAGCLAICSIYIDMIVYAPILGEIAKKLGVEMGVATNLMMGFVLSVACVLIWGGVVCDKFGITFALVLGLFCSTLPTLLIPWVADSYPAVLTLRLIQGASVGFVFATIGPILALWFPPAEQGLASGLLIGSISLGSAIGVFGSPALLETTGSWGKTVFLMGTPGWAAILLAILVTRKMPPQPVAPKTAGPAAPAGEESGLRAAFCYPMTWVGSFIVFFNAWGMYCLYNLVPAYLASNAPLGLGLGPATAGRLSIAVTIVGLFATISGGVFFDKVAKGNARIATCVGFLLAACAALILQSTVSGNVLILAIILMISGWGMPFMNPSLSAFIATNYPPRIVGRMVGWWYGFGTFGGAAGLYLGGMSISRTGSFYLAIGMISVAALLGSSLSLFLKTGKDIPATLQPAAQPAD